MNRNSTMMVYDLFKFLEVVVLLFFFNVINPVVFTT